MAFLGFCHEVQFHQFGILEDQRDDHCMQTEQIELPFLVFFRPHLQIGRVHFGCCGRLAALDLNGDCNAEISLFDVPYGSVLSEDGEFRGSSDQLEK